MIFRRALPTSLNGKISPNYAIAERDSGTFQDLPQLSAHEYFCPICNKSFPFRNAMYRHLRGIEIDPREPNLIHTCKDVALSRGISIFPSYMASSNSSNFLSLRRQSVAFKIAHTEPISEEEFGKIYNDVNFTCYKG